MYIFHFIVTYLIALFKFSKGKGEREWKEVLGTSSVAYFIPAVVIVEIIVFGVVSSLFTYGTEIGNWGEVLTSGNRYDGSNKLEVSIVNPTLEFCIVQFVYLLGAFGIAAKMDSDGMD